MNTTTMRVTNMANRRKELLFATVVAEQLEAGINELYGLYLQVLDLYADDMRLPAPETFPKPLDDSNSIYDVVTVFMCQFAAWQNTLTAEQHGIIDSTPIQIP